MLERLEWFDRPERPRRRRVVVVPSAEPTVTERPRAAAAVEPEAQSTRPSTSLPLPPWEARGEPSLPAVLEEAPTEAARRWLVAPPRPVEPIAPTEVADDGASTAVAQPAPAAEQTMRVYRGRLRAALLGLVALAVSGAFIFAASRLDSQETTTSAPKSPAASAAARPATRPASPKPQPTPKPKPTAKPTPKPKPKPTAKPKPKPKPTARPTPKAKPTPTKPSRRAPVPPPTSTLPPFAWTPVAGASAYEFQLFFGSKLLYTQRTATTGITVPSTWTKNGKLFQIVPGHYRWYVWAIVGGQRSTKAIVQATLDVPK